ncbi:DNA cytosine methyltransferase, partial [Paenochrobactrum sp. BZR 588]|uniref:DNA cytosine methyltransferase n=1 Tax=unclassified Paenochrobactrum TaxID=2639760 RepID=UPI0038554BCB
SQRDLNNIFAMGPLIADLSPDLICGGPPCQDYSVAGKRIEGENAGLTKAFAMLVCIARPEWFIMENVPQAARSDAWQVARAMLVKAGYGLCRNVSWMRPGMELLRSVNVYLLLVVLGSSMVF